MSFPTVSVCIPAYKAEAYILQALESIKAQTFSDWEIIVTEDGSRDKTEEIVRAFSRTVQQPVIYNRHEVNRGLPHTRNTNIAATSGRWIAFLDADDYWKPDHLARLLAATEAGDIDMAFAGFTRLDQQSGQMSGDIIPSQEQLNNLAPALFCGSLSIMPSAVLIRRDTFDRFGPVSCDFAYTNDTEYWLRILSNGGKIRYSGSATCIYRVHQASMSRRFVELMEDSARLCESYSKWSAIPWRVKRKRPARLYRLAAVAAEPLDQTKAYSLLRMALRVDPFNLKTLLSFPRLILRAATRTD